MAVPGCQIQAGGAHCRRRGAGRLERLAEERILGSRPVWPYAGVLRVVNGSQLCCAVDTIVNPESWLYPRSGIDGYINIM